MNNSLLIVYATTDGHTAEISKRIQQIAETGGWHVTLSELPADGKFDLDAFDRVVVGASIRYGKHKPEVKKFIDASQATLEAKNAAFFSVNAVARKPAKKTAETNPYVRKFLTQIEWQPQTVGIFGGKIEYPKYGWFDRNMIRFIMWMGKGPTDPTGTFEFTDWDAVEQFGRDVIA